MSFLVTYFCLRDRKSKQVSVDMKTSTQRFANLLG